MTAPTLGKRVRAEHAVLALGKRVRASLSADVTASLRAGGVASFVDSAGDTWEWSSFKTRYVRTAAGVKRYGRPIGSPIVGRAAGGVRLQVNPSERKTVQDRFGGDKDGSRTGARVNDKGELEVVDRDRLDRTIAEGIENPDTSEGERKQLRSLRRRVDRLPAERPASDDEGGSTSDPDGDAPAAPDEPDPPAEPVHRYDHEELEQDWAENGPTLSDDDEAEIQDYVGNGFSELNQYQRGNLDYDPSEEEIADLQRRAQALKEIQSRYTLPGSATLYRRVPDGVLPPHPAPAGSTFRDKAFMSTSTDSDTFEHFPNVMEIDVPKGTPAINVHAVRQGVSDEREILLPPGLKLQITSDEIRDGKRWVKMTAVPE